MWSKQLRKDIKNNIKIMKKDKLTKRIVIPQLLCIDSGEDIGLTVGEKYNRFILDESDCLIKDDFGELCVMKLKNFKVIEAQ